MFLSKKIQASGIAEMVIAVSIIVICIGLTSILFVRSTKSSTSFENVVYQTEIQNQLWNYLLNESMLELPEGLTEKTEEDVWCQRVIYSGSGEKVVWTQDQLKDE